MTTQSVEAAIVISAREQASQALALVAQAMRGVIEQARAMSAESAIISASLAGIGAATSQAIESQMLLTQELGTLRGEIAQTGAVSQEAFVGNVIPSVLQAIESFNQTVVPVTNLAGGIKDVADVVKLGKQAFDNYDAVMNPVQEKLIAVRGKVGEFMGSLQALMPVLQSVSISMRAVLIASGIGLVIAILGVLFLAWQNNWGGIQEKVKAVVEFIRELIGKFVDFIKEHWDKIATILTLFIGGPLAAFAVAWTTNAFGIRDKLTEIWNKIKSFLSDTWNSIKDTASNIFDTIKNSIEGVWNRIKDITSNVWDSVVGSLKTAINTIIGFINKLIRAWNGLKLKIPGFEKDFGLFKIGFEGIELGVPEIPEIPLLAQGGVVRRPTLAMLGEAGPEAIVPLRRGGRGFDSGGALRHMQPIVVNVIVDGRVVKSMAVEGVREAFVNAGLGPGAFAPGV